jgi:multiple sugar transport system substrate-binding protein
MKRALVFLAAASIMVGACSSTPAATTAPSAAPSAAASVAAASVAASAAPSVAASAPTGEKDQIDFVSGTGVVTDHPFFAMVADYNRTHPDVDVKLNMYTWDAGAGFELGTRLGAGNPPDIMRLSVPGVAGNGALQSPLLVDVKPYLTPEEVADYGPDILAPIDNGGRYVLWPQDRDWGTCIVANGKMLADAGIDVAKIQKDGWTFDEFREVAKKLTSGSTYGYGFSNDYAGSALLELLWRAGIPDGNANMGPYFWGNKFDYTGPDAVQAAGMLHDMIYVDKSVPKEVTGLKEHMPLLWTGKVAMINYWHGAVGEIKAYNDSIDKGAVKGQKADFPVVLLPWPYDPENGANVNVARTTGLAVFKQNPYKGDAHMQHVVDLLRYLTSPVNLATFANWEGTIPAKNSAFPYATQLKDAQVAWWASWAKAHAVYAFPYGHPAYGPIWSDAMQPAFTSLLNDEKTAQQAVDEWTAAANPIMDKWVKDNPDLAKEWATAPTGWPGVYMTPLAK